jgi:hypothetical protein
MLRDRSEESWRALVASPFTIKEYYSYNQSCILSLVLTRVLLTYLWQEPVGETNLSMIQREAIYCIGQGLRATGV